MALDMTHADTKAELTYLEYVLGELAAYRETALAQKEQVDQSVTYSRKHFNSDNTEQFTELTIYMSRQDWLNLRVKMSARSLQKPYFTRVDFTADDVGASETFYIGKMSLIREADNALLIADWRAPVSNLYYEGRLGRAAYAAPEGEIAGEITLKRQYVIEKGEMQDFFDIDITANDDFLQAALGSSKDSRLKDIVSTIQAEQNRVIRADMVRPLIVQGAAGGGKTTIALHRIAYLLYNFEKRLSPHNIMILAPNRYFLSYISEVLPDLGVENVFQTTFADFALAFTDEEENLRVRYASEKLAYMIHHPQHAQAVARVSTIKSSLTFKNLINRYVDELVAAMLPEDGADYALDEYVLMPYAEVRRLLCEEYSFLPVQKRIGEVRKYLKSALQKEKPEILRRLHFTYDFYVGMIKDEMPEDSEARRARITAVLNERDAKIARIEKLSKDAVRRYLKKTTLSSAFQYYRRLMMDEDLLCRLGANVLTAAEWQAVHAQSAPLLKGRQKAVEEEDLAALMHIHFRLFGNEYYDLRHIVVDEAQDIGLFQLFVLREVMNSDSFTILGDLCQGIYAHKGVKDWAAVADRIFKGKAVQQTLVQSYRTTVEIMDAANVVIAKLGLDVPLAQPVIRHGAPVVTEICADEEAAAAYIRAQLESFRADGLQSMAVLCKTIAECDALAERLNDDNAGAPVIVLRGTESSYGGGAVVMPAYLAKGLEFDGVILANASDAVYTDDPLDIKLLYIAMTRALHRLAVVRRGCTLRTPLSP